MIHSVNYLNRKIEKNIDELAFDQNPNSLFEPIKYILSLGGKRIRPLLTLMSANLFSDNVDIAIKSAIGIEIFHNFTLLHDDLMDKSDLRRGKETVHKKWNSNTAILSGDAMLIEAYKYISDTKLEFLPEVLALFNKTAMEVCKGQQFDMNFEKRNDVTVEEYIEMIRLKTAVLLACSLKMGALLSDASHEDATQLYDFGINIGLAFQLKDDLLDVYGDTEKFGKAIGGDILNNKKTFLLIKAYELSNEQQKNELDRWVYAKQYKDEEKINAVKNIYNELNLKIVSDNLINKYYLSALKSLSRVKVSEERKKELYQLTESLMLREY